MDAKTIKMDSGIAPAVSLAVLLLSAFWLPLLRAQSTELENPLSFVSIALQVENDRYRRVEFLEPHPQVYYVRTARQDAENAADKSSSEASLPSNSQEWLPAKIGSPSGDEVHLSRQIVLKTEAPVPEETIRRLSLETVRQIHPRLIILAAADPLRALETAQALCRKPGTLACYPVMRRSYRRAGKFSPRPNDTYFSQCWHVDNRDGQGQRQGVDLNLRSAWSAAKGQGVTVAVVDGELDLEHPDLSGRTQQGPHFNFGATNPNNGDFLDFDAHGTAVAGLIAAEGNNETGVIGAAPQANLSSLVIFDNQLGMDSVVDDLALMDAFQFRIDKIAVQNHSWGPGPFRVQQAGIDALADAGIENAVRNGRAGKGVVMVRAGGNERESLQNANDNGFANDPRSIAVGAVRFDGSPASYSTRGACLLVSAPSGDTDFPGLATTDRQGAFGYVWNGRDDLADYLIDENGFEGTSGSAPLIAGIAALILSANPSLSYRDVQQILIHSSFQPENGDPDVEANGAGFSFSHNTGYGIPDAGFAVELAKIWKNRPETVEVSKTRRLDQQIPDAGLQLEIGGNRVPPNLRSIQALPSFGTFADAGTAGFPLVFAGEALEPISARLQGRAALIRRGSALFVEKIRRAREAGAEFAVIFNHQDEDEIVLMAGTDFSAIPALSVNQNDGEALSDLLQSQSDITAKISLNAASVEFNVSDTLICEHVGLQLDTTHTRRGDLRIVLLSPSGSRSILQTLNADESAGPQLWTYWSVKHFFEPSAGVWKLTVLDQEPEDFGSIASASLILRGVPIVDADRDGLDDHWERSSFGSLASGPQADPDGDGFNNAREQILQTPPTIPNRPFAIDHSHWNPQTLRLSWPAQPGNRFQVLKRSPITAAPQIVADLPGQFPENEFLLPLNRSSNEFYTIQKLQ